MPEKKEILTEPGYDAQILQVLVYGTFQKLNWTTDYAVENNLWAHTLRKSGKKGEEIKAAILDGEVTLTSKLIHGESFDITGKNKEHLNDFMAAFGEVKNNLTEEEQSGWKTAIEALRESTLKAAEEQKKQMAEIEKVMNLSKGGRVITYGIIAINALVFLAMGISGISWIEPTAFDILKWGANYAPLTLSGDWWRLISCVFVHIGLIHIAFNMYALFSIGVYLEPMLGKVRYAAAYLCTGVFASLASLAWHSTPVPSAGASGAIFGMYGVFLALLSTNLIPKQLRTGLLQGIGIFVGYNLLYGLKSGVDNAAHIGGLVSGLVIGYAYFFSLKENTSARIKLFIPVVIGLLTLLATLGYLREKKVSREVRDAVTKEIENSGYKDEGKFNEKYNAIIEIQEKAMAPYKDSLLNDQERAKQLREKSLPEWENAGRIADQLRDLQNLPEGQKKKADAVAAYIKGRIEEINIVTKIAADPAEQLYRDLQKERTTLDSLVTILNGL